MSNGAVLVVARDLMMRSRLEDAARATGLEVRAASALPDPDPSVALLVLDLDMPGIAEGLGGWREADAGLRMVGFISHVDRDGWAAAEAAGCEVHPRGRSTAAAQILTSA